MSKQNSAVAGMTFSEIAKSAYLAYAASTGNKNYQGLPMPEFEDLPIAIQTAWECAARQMRVCLTATGDQKAGTLDESRWEEFTKIRISS